MEELSLSADLAVALGRDDVDLLVSTPHATTCSMQSCHRVRSSTIASCEDVRRSILGDLKSGLEEDYSRG